MNTHHLFLYCFLIALFTLEMSSCNGNKAGSSEDKSKYHVDTFSVFPPDIVGCSAYYATDSLLFTKQGYIVMGDCAQMAYVKLNGVLTKFNQVELKMINKQHSIQRFTSGKMELVLDIIDGAMTGSEVWRQTGKMTLKDDEGKTIQMKLFGESGY